MSNHSSQDMTPEERRHFEKMLGLGPTNRFPEGKVHPTDEGELKLAVGHGNGKVFMDFGSPTAWIGFTRRQAIDIAKVLIEHATQLPEIQP